MKIWLLLAIAILGLVLAVVIPRDNLRTKECEAKGGLMIPTAGAYTCVRLERIP